MISFSPADGQGDRLPFFRSSKGTGSWKIPLCQSRLDHLFSLARINRATRGIHAPDDSIHTDHAVQDGKSERKGIAPVSVLFRLGVLSKLTGAQQQW
jgi:hypothetical protein